MERAASAVSRRNILIGMGAAAVTAGVAVTAFGPAPTSRARRLLASTPFTRRFLSLAHAERSEWAAQVGSDFSVAGGYALRLAGVRPLQSAGERPSNVSRERGFVAVFDVRRGVSMAGDLIYTIAHPQYGRLPVFLTATDDPRRMLAVFN
ncbi:MAG TPA: hypothetical protein VN231_01345 [Allosphingosinicella sp.]|nr:hypothetical protein [Allosphingosinicella sp.]